MNKLYVVGFGSGSQEHMTQQAIEVLEEVDLIVGYTSYVELIRKILPQKNYLTTPMRREEERCLIAIKEAKAGKKVALVSSGDSGIYGMAGIVLQLVQEQNAQVEVEVVPGVTAVSLASAVLGAPLMHDFAIISLSDLMTPFEKIEKRVECAAIGDFITCFYNPRSHTRFDYIQKMAKIMLKWQKKEVPVGIVRHAGREEEESKLITLEKLAQLDEWTQEEKQFLDMFCVVIVGNSSTYVKNGKMITPRGYQLEKRKESLQ